MSLYLYELLWKIPQIPNLPFHIICVFNSPLLCHSWSECTSRKVSWILFNILKTIIYTIPCGISLWKNDAIAVGASQTYCYRFIFTPVKCYSILLSMWLLLNSVLGSWGNTVFNGYQAMFTINTKPHQTSMENKTDLLSLPLSRNYSRKWLFSQLQSNFQLYSWVYSTSYLPFFPRAVTNDNESLKEAETPFLDAVCFITSGLLSRTDLELSVPSGTCCLVSDSLSSW